jgi:hypothetical protein
MKDETMIARVVNLRHEPYDIYIGRAGNGEPTNVPGGDGVFGNPYGGGGALAHAANSRADSIAMHRLYFRGRLAHDYAFRTRVLELLKLPRPAGELRLGCFCKQPGSPVACHGDVIAEYLNSMENER